MDKHMLGLMAIEWHRTACILLDKTSSFARIPNHTVMMLVEQSIQ